MLCWEGLLGGTFESNGSQKQAFLVLYRFLFSEWLPPRGAIRAKVHVNKKHVASFVSVGYSVICMQIVLICQVLYKVSKYLKLIEDE